jgi:hypothetical protein
MRAGQPRIGASPSRDLADALRVDPFWRKERR